LPGRKGLLPVERRLELPHRLRRVGIDGGEAEPVQLLLLGRRRLLEPLIEVEVHRVQGEPEALDDLSLVEAEGDHAGLELRHDGRAVDRHGEVHEVLGLRVGQDEVHHLGHDRVDRGQREGDEVGHRRVGAVAEMVRDADLARRDEEVLGQHLDRVVADELQPARPELGGRIVGIR
jgi:hypothetical protein